MSNFIMLYEIQKKLWESEKKLCSAEKTLALTFCPARSCKRPHTLALCRSGQLFQVYRRQKEPDDKYIYYGSNMQLNLFMAKIYLILCKMAMLNQETGILLLCTFHSLKLISIKTIHKRGRSNSTIPKAEVRGRETIVMKRLGKL